MNDSGNSFESRMERLNQIVSILEQESADLEKSLELYQEGLRLAALCRKQLETMQNELIQLEKTDLDEPASHPSCHNPENLPDADSEQNMDSIPF
ncbi:MAG: exodeoxyribonuclease VII small subunit [Desulfovibrionaceae bacterium]|nr:exodeoxyribonuclease VII small subunit [Desulfovibrionaceae bacterium]